MVYYQLIVDILNRGELIKISTKSTPKEISSFLNQLNQILTDVNFDVDQDFWLIRSNKTKDKEAYSTPYTLIELDYNISDVLRELQNLSISNYSETLIDRNDLNPPLLYVFGKHINSKIVYIKLKIKENQNKQVLCVSFHYAEHEMVFPFSYEMDKIVSNEL